MTAEPEQVTIVGSGSIGVAWSIVFARAGHPVVLYDTDAGRSGTALSELSKRLEALHSFQLLAETPEVISDRVRFDSSLGRAVDGSSYVQECVPESLPLKRSVFAALDVHVDPRAIIASSSSALTPTLLFQESPHRHRCLVVHPGNPPYLLPVAELVAAPFTAEETVDRSRTLLEASGMVTVLVRGEVEGFVFNRLQGALLREAYCLVRDGVVDPLDIDRIVSLGLGRRWAVTGPFETVDLNTRGGIAAHAKRMGPAYARMGAERGQNDPWTEQMVSMVNDARRRELPLEDWDDRVLWRDRMLMVLERARMIASS